MSDENKILVIDNCSLVNYFDHYFFDRDYSKKVYEKLKNFLFEKIRLKEIVVIDKVFDEFTTIRNNGEINDLRGELSSYIVDTTSLIDEVQVLQDTYYKSENERFYRDNTGQINYNLIDRILDRYLDRHADLYLVVYCKNHPNSILVTDESFRNDNKILEKIPAICRGERVNLLNLPDTLFHYYKDELHFKLN